ncbi:MAG: hypothetical protein IT457_13670 [Planctomycetes bacterium]|nr:hypothetical protein [Planctomycetota bacterium]
MTVFGMGYRRLVYEPSSRFRRILCVALTDLRAPFRTRLSTILFLVCQAPTFSSFVLLFIWSGFWQIGGGRGMTSADRGFPGSAQFYLANLTAPEAFLSITTLVAFTVSRAVARDRASNALEILWTRGLSPAAWFAGKVLGACFVLGIGTIAAPLLLWLLAVATAPDVEFLANTARFMPLVVLAAGVQTFVIAFLATALSAAARTPNAASILWVVAVFGGSAVARVVGRLSGWVELRALSPWDATTRVTQAIVDVPPRVELPVTAALISLAVLGVFALAAVVRRVRLAETVG